MKKLVIKLVLSAFLIVSFSCKNTSEKDNENETVNSENIAENTQTAQQPSFSEELSQSPRHHEWVKLSHGNREFEAFVVYPETDSKAKSVIVIHENRGLNDWARLFADQLAAEGYLVIAPDLISNTVDGIKRTTDFENSDAAREAIYSLEQEQVTADLNSAFEYIKNDPASSGEVAVVGFCWGGSQSFRYATTNPKLSSAHVFYGTAPEDPDLINKIEIPVFGYYGGDDNRVNSTLEKTEQLMEEAGNKFEYEIYEGAGHAFMRSGHQADAKEANKEAHDKAWERLKKLLK